MNNSFYEWLMTKIGNDDPIGDLASDVEGDKSFPKNLTSENDIKKYIEQNNGCPEAIEAVTDAFIEFKNSRM